MVHLQDVYYLMIGCSQQATSNIALKDILRGKSGRRNPLFSSEPVLKTTDFQKPLIFEYLKYV